MTVEPSYGHEGGGFRMTVEPSYWRERVNKQVWVKWKSDVLTKKKKNFT